MESFFPEESIPETVGSLPKLLKPDMLFNTAMGGIG